MKSILFSLALIPLVLTGCAVGGGYYSDYPGYYGPGYYDGPDVGVAFYSGGSYHHGYSHYDSSYHHGSYTASTAYHSSHVASTSRSFRTGGSSVHTASVSSGRVHASVSSGHHHE